MNATTIDPRADSSPTTSTRLAHALTFSLLATPPLVVMTWQLAYNYASTHGADVGDNAFGWAPLFVWGPMVMAWFASGALALLTRGGRPTLIAGTTLGLFFAVGCVLVAYGPSIPVSGGHDFPAGPDIWAVVIAGAIVSLLPPTIVWVLALRDGRRDGRKAQP